MTAPSLTSPSGATGTAPGEGSCSDRASEADALDTARRSSAGHAPSSTEPLLGAADDPVRTVERIAAHGNTRAVLAEHWVEAAERRWNLRFFDELSSPVRIALTPRDASTIGGEVVRKDFAYSMALTALAALLGTTGLALVGPISSLAAALLVGLVVHRATGSPLIASYLRTSAPKEATRGHLYESVPGWERLAEVVSMIDRQRLFIANDGGWISEPGRVELEALFPAEGTCLRHTPLDQLWELVPCRTSG